MKRFKSIYLFTCVGVLILGGVILVTASLLPRNGGSPTVVDSKYAGIEINKVISKSLKEGEGSKIKVGDRVQAYLAIWVYEPAKPGNRGDLLYKTSDDKPESFFIESQETKKLEAYIRGMSAKAQKQLIVPPTEHSLFEDIPITPKNKDILLVEVRVFDVF